MKIKEYRLLAAITAAFFLFTVGFFLGRNRFRPGITTERIAPTVPTLSITTATEASPVETTQVPEPAYPLDINAASADELSFLPGIGPVIAGRIVAYRENNGPYQALTDLLNVEGIGPTRLDEMLPYIIIGG